MPVPPPTSAREKELKIVFYSFFFLLKRFQKLHLNFLPKEYGTNLKLSTSLKSPSLPEFYL
jgi:hypothetical protein